MPFCSRPSGPTAETHEPEPDAEPLVPLVHSPCARPMLDASAFLEAAWSLPLLASCLALASSLPVGSALNIIRRKAEARIDGLQPATTGPDWRAVPHVPNKAIFRRTPVLDYKVARGNHPFILLSEKLCRKEPDAS